MKLNNKRAQEEIVGFVIIVLLVSVVALVFFGISLRKTAPVESSIRVENFVSGVMGVTTQCSLKAVVNYLDVGELIRECRKGSDCYDGRESCEALNQTITGLFDEAFTIETNVSPTTYYSFKAYYSENISGQEGGEVFYALEKGECQGGRSGNTQSISNLPGIIRVETQICTS